MEVDAINAVDLISDSSKNNNSQSINPELNQIASESKQQTQNTNRVDDSFCWICHTDSNVINCYLCPRAYHLKCIGLLTSPLKNWICSECKRLEITEKENRMLSKVTPEQFQLMLNNAIKRLIYPDSTPFQTKVDQTVFTEYSHYVVNPMDLSLMESKIKENQYTSLDAFLTDIKWIVHNCSVFNGPQSRLTSIAKSLLRMIKHEISEMDVCPDCYLNSILKYDDNWFCEPCRVPHPLIWAKMKGFPFWPAKALRVVNDDVDVRFFGAHDRAWIHVSNCFWLSKEMPKSNQRQKVTNLDASLDELNMHINRLILHFGEFVHAPFRSTFIPDKQFVFIPSLADQCCLSVIINENMKNVRRNSTNLLLSDRLSNDTNSNDAVNLIDSPSILTTVKRKRKKRNPYTTKRQIMYRLNHKKQKSHDGQQAHNDDTLSIQESVLSLTDSNNKHCKQSLNESASSLLSSADTESDMSNSSFMDANQNTQLDHTEKSNAKENKSVLNMRDMIETCKNIKQNVNIKNEQFKNVDIDDEIKKAVNEYKRTIEIDNKKEMDAIKKEFEHLIKEIRHNSDLKIKELISECAKEKSKMQFKYEKLIEDVKKKQWCSNCSKEAIYYCCWNTSYCDEECQRAHWNIHMNSCLRGKVILDSQTTASAGSSEEKNDFLD